MERQRKMHNGELEVQKRKGVDAEASDINEIVVDFVSHQWPPFLRIQRFVFVASREQDGTIWASALFGNRGFVSVPDEQTIHIAAVPNTVDPLHKCITSQENAPFALLVVDFANRKRYRANGVVQKVAADGITMRISESYPNCPKYIQQRQVVKLNENAAAANSKMEIRSASNKLEEEHIKLIRNADTFLIGSYASEGGADVSHRGGLAGFVRVVSASEIQFPDYVGNTLLMTLGNIQANPNVALLFPNFDTGNWMQLSGKAKLIWDAVPMDGATLFVSVTIERVHILQNFCPFLFSFQTYSPYNPELSGIGAEKDVKPKEFVECMEIRNETPLVKTYRFFMRKARVIVPGQFVILEIQLPNTNETLERSWTISSAHSNETNFFEVTVKRKTNGKVSTWMHDELKVGTKFSLRGIDGDFSPFCRAPPSSPIPIALQPKFSDQSILLLGAGSGFTPLMSILRAFCALRYQNRIVVHFSVQTRDDVIFAKDLESIATNFNESVQLRLCFTKATEALAGAVTSSFSPTTVISHGRISKSALEELYKSSALSSSLSQSSVFLCGPETYIQEADTHLKEIYQGSNTYSIFTERYY